MTLSITFTLPGDDLTLASDPSTGLWLDETAIVLPSFAVRTSTAPQSDFYSGSVLLSWVREVDEIQFAVYAEGANRAGLAAKMATLEAALLSTGAITVTEHGVATTYIDRWPAAPRWDGVQSPIHDAFIRRATAAIQINPS